VRERERERERREREPSGCKMSLNLMC